MSIRSRYRARTADDRVVGASRRSGSTTRFTFPSSTTIGIDRKSRLVAAGPLVTPPSEVLALAVGVVARARDEGRVADADPELDGYALVTLAGALGTDVVLRGAPLDRARAALDRQVVRVTGRSLGRDPA